MSKLKEDCRIPPIDPMDPNGIEEYLPVHPMKGWAEISPRHDQHGVAFLPGDDLQVVFGQIVAIDDPPETLRELGIALRRSRPLVKSPDQESPATGLLPGMASSEAIEPAPEAGLGPTVALSS